MPLFQEQRRVQDEGSLRIDAARIGLGQRRPSQRWHRASYSIRASLRGKFEQLTEMKRQVETLTSQLKVAQDQLGPGQAAL